MKTASGLLRWTLINSINNNYRLCHTKIWIKRKELNEDTKKAIKKNYAKNRSSIIGQTEINGLHRAKPLAYVTQTIKSEIDKDYKGYEYQKEKLSLKLLGENAPNVDIVLIGGHSKLTTSTAGEINLDKVKHRNNNMKISSKILKTIQENTNYYVLIVTKLNDMMKRSRQQAVLASQLLYSCYKAGHASSSDNMSEASAAPAPREEK